MPQIVIKQFKGLNTDRARLQIQPGEMPYMQNMRQRPYDNIAKRQGIEPVDSSDSPYYGIREFEFDDVIVTLAQNGPTLTFNKNFSSASNPAGISFDTNQNNGNNIDSEGQFVLFNVEQVMRAVRERYLACGLAFGTGWPVSKFNIDGTERTVDPSDAPILDYPPNNLYQYDLAWADEKGYDVGSITVAAGSPKGTFATALVNFIRSKIIASTLLARWCNMDVGMEGQAVMNTALAPTPYYSDVTIGLPSAATISTYKQVFVLCRAAVRKLYAHWYVDSNFYLVNRIINNRYKVATRNGSSEAEAVNAVQTVMAGAGYTTGTVRAYGHRCNVTCVGATSYTADIDIVEFQCSIQPSVSWAGYSNSGTIDVYLNFDQSLWGSSYSSGTVENAWDCPVAADGTYHKWKTYSYSGTGDITLDWVFVTSNSTSPTIPSTTGGVVGLTIGRGWAHRSGYAFIGALVRPNFTYNV